MLILGEKEAESNLVSIRSRKEGDLGQIELNKFIEKIKEEIENFVI